MSVLIRNFKSKALPQAIRLALGSIALAPLALSTAHAQQAGGDAAIQTVEVTGSHIRRADKETASPLQVITADDLKKSGYTTVSEVLRNVTANGQGTLSQGFSQAFAAGASGIALRGLTVGATLVLIDGHRMAPFPLSDDGQRSFVDISSIPFDAIERVEILKDGASATYGSDAIAGVVNIILKKNLVGTKISVEAGKATEGAGTTKHLSLSHGVGDYDADGFNAFGTLEYRHQERIVYGDRSGDGNWQNLNWTPYGGVNKTPGIVTPQNPTPITRTPFLTDPNQPSGAAGTSFYPGACNYALQQAGGCGWQSPLAEISPQTENINVMGSLTKKLGGDWKLDLKASLFDSKAEQYPAGATQYFPFSYSPLVAVSAGVLPHAVGATIPAVTVPANYPGNPFGGPALVNGIVPDVGPPNTQIDSKAVRLVAGLTGTLAGWDIDSSIGYTKVTTTQDIYNSINVPALNDALNRPTSPFMVTGGNSAADLATIFPRTSAKDTSELDFAELHASRSLFKLSGGDLGLSTGVSFVRRVLSAPAPDLIAQGLVQGNNAYAEGTQNDAAAYVEMVAPVLKTLELEGALRFDHYNNSGNSTTPKVGFKFTPIKEVAFRGTYSTGFRAPNPAENGQAGNAYLADSTNDPVLCPGGIPASGNIARGSVISACNYQPPYLSASNPALQPEKSKSATLGLILEPISGWSTTIDLFKIRINNQIVAGPASNTPVRADPVQSLLADGNGGSYTGTPAVGPVLYYASSYINANSTQTSGVELDTRYKFKLHDYGDLTADLQITHMASYVMTVGGVAYQLAGTHGPFITSGDTGNPKNRAQFSLTWDKGPLQIASTLNWISSFDLTDPSYHNTLDCNAGAGLNGWFPDGNAPTQYCKVASFLDTDLSVQYKLGANWLLHGSVTNLFNKQPPVDLNTYGGGQLPYNPSMHMTGAIGRFINVGATYSF